MPEATIIDALYQQNRELIEFLRSAGEISQQANADSAFRKILLLSSASYFEHVMKEIMVNFVVARSGGDSAILALVKNKVIERQYHTYFDWDKKNANKFFSLFGDEFSVAMKKLVDEDDILKEAVIAFLEIGSLRNNLVHLNFANYPLDKTVEEIYQLYQRALVFLDCLQKYMIIPVSVE